MRKILLFAIISVNFLFFHTNSFGQICRVSPDKPIWGSHIRVIYNPLAEGAAFLPGDDVYAIYYVHISESPEVRWAKMEEEKNLLSCDISVEEGMAYFNFYFINMDKWDRNANLSVMVFEKEGIPARGAYHQKMLSSFSKDSYEKLYQKELELYPNNYEIYRDKWFIQGAIDKERFIDSLKHEMEYLLKNVKERTAGLLYSLSYGHMLLKEEEASRRILREMIEKYPNSYYTGTAFKNYDYQVLSQQLKGEGPKQVEQMKLEYISSNPNTKYSRDQSLSLSKNEDFPIEILERICLEWIKADSENPMPYYSLAQAYSKRKIHLSQADEFINKAIDLLLQGRLRLFLDISGAISEMFLPAMFKTSAEIHVYQGNYAKALSAIKTAQAFQAESRPEYLLNEAEIWTSLGYYLRAEKIFAQAHRVGSPETEESLKKIYLKRHKNLDGFTQYIDKLLKQTNKSEEKQKEMAPAFQVETIQGHNLEMEKLKGKVVVLNFWFIGCAPCRVEIPGLNKLSDEFSESEVVFIAFALDNADELEKFLDEYPFKYKIVPGSGKIASSYGVNIYPTHIIINKSGLIEYRLTGGNETRHEQLRPLIKNLLR